MNALTVTRDAIGNVVLGGGDWLRVVAERSGRYYGQQMTAGHIYTVGGTGHPYSADGVPATEAELSPSAGISTNAAGDMAIGDSANDIVEVVMARSGTFFGRHMKAGAFYRVAGSGHGFFGGDGGPARKARLRIGGSGDVLVTFDPAGNLVLSDELNNRVRVVAVRTGRFYGRSMTAGDIYTIAGIGFVRKSSGDGGPATKAGLAFPRSVWADQHGDLFIVDSDRVRVVASRTATLFGKPMKAGNIYTVANTSAVPGDVLGISAVTVDAAGNLIITVPEQVLVVAARTGTFYGQPMTVGHMYLLAGTGKFGFGGIGGPALQATFDSASGVITDQAGNVVFANNGVVLAVAERTGTFYGQAMTAGYIYIVAGGGPAPIGDGGPATGARIFANSVASTPAGTLLVADPGNSRVREISPP